MLRRVLDVHAAMTPYDLVFLPTFGAGCVISATLAWKAPGRGLLAQACLLLASFATLWLALIAGVCFGYDAWQTMPNPPDEAFADGAKLVGSVLFGWLPAGFGTLSVFVLSHAWRAWRRRATAAES